MSTQTYLKCSDSGGYEEKALEGKLRAGRRTASGVRGSSAAGSPRPPSRPPRMREPVPPALDSSVAPHLPPHKHGFKVHTDASVIRPIYLPDIPYFAISSLGTGNGSSFGHKTALTWVTELACCALFLCSPSLSHASSWEI